jgi:hypothetical protein
MPRDAMPSPRPAYGSGVYRRRILLSAEGTRVRAELEDDFHRFAVELDHDGRSVLAARGEAARFPWTTCPGATARIEALAGVPLLARAVELAGHADASLHCTHMYDLAALALAHAAARRARRRYDAAVTDRVQGACRATLARDGTPLLDWQVQGHQLGGPAPWKGVSLRGRGFLDWLDANLDPDTAEAGLVLRRALFIALGRATDLDGVARASEIQPLTGASCHTFQPGVAGRAQRMQGATRDWTDTPDALLWTSASLPTAGAGPCTAWSAGAGPRRRPGRCRSRPGP